MTFNYYNNDYTHNTINTIANVSNNATNVNMYIDQSFFFLEECSKACNNLLYDCIYYLTGSNGESTIVGNSSVVVFLFIHSFFKYRNQWINSKLIT